MANIPKTQWRTAALKPASQRKGQRHVVTITVGGAPSGAVPQVPLLHVLDSFRQLKDPNSRVVGGFFHNSQTHGENEARAVFSGVASPGSQVSVTLADEVGQPIDSQTVYSDAAGNWMAPFGQLSTLDKSALVSIEVLPTSWGGAVNPSLMTFDFPAQKISNRGDGKSTTNNKLVAAVFEATDITKPF